MDRRDAAGLLLRLHPEDGTCQETTGSLCAWGLAHGSILRGTRNQHLRRSAAVARLPDHRTDGDGLLQLREVSAVTRLPADDDRTWHHDASAAGEREEPRRAVGDGLRTGADVLLRAPRVCGPRCCSGIGARVPQARAMDAALVLRHDTRELRLLVVGGLRALDRGHRGAVPRVPLVCRPQEAAQGLVAGVSLSPTPTR